MSTRPVRILTRFGLASLAVMVLVGCPEDAADIVEIKATSLDFAVAPLAPIAFPAGDVSVDNIILADFDTTVMDAFARSIAGNRSFYSSTGSQFGGAYPLNPFLSTSATDTRLPALTEDDVTLGVNPDGLVLLDDSGLGFGGGFHNIFNDSPLANLQPNTTYIVAFFRYGTQVNAELDAAAVALGDPVTAPDQLVTVDGTPKGNPTVPIEAFPTIVPFQTDANPFIVGNFTTDGSGNGFFDAVIDGTGTLYSDDSGDPPDAAFDSSLVGRNDDTPTALPRYNYVVILEGPAVDAADAADNPQAVRFQIAQDFVVSSEATINNGYAPFPNRIPDTQLVGAPGGAGRPDSLSVEFLNLQSLASGAVWQAWLVNRAESPPTMAPATGTYERVAILREFDPITGELLSEADSVLDSTAGTSSFSGQLGIDLPDVENRQDPAEVKHRIVLSDASVSGDAAGVGFFTDVVLTIEPGGPASMPSDIKPVWFEFTDQNGTPANFFDDVSQSGSLNFGEFNPADPAASRVVGPGEFVQATGLGGVLTEGAATQAVSVDIKNLPLPPRGFYYEGWLTHLETGETMSMGPVTSLPPDTVSLLDADIDPDLPGVIPTGIRFANAFVEVDPGTLVDMQVAGMDTTFTVNLTSFFLTMEPKVGVAAKNVADLEIGSLPSATIISRMRNP